MQNLGILARDVLTNDVINVHDHVINNVPRLVISINFGLKWLNAEALTWGKICHFSRKNRLF